MIDHEHVLEPCSPNLCLSLEMCLKVFGSKFVYVTCSVNKLLPDEQVWAQVLHSPPTIGKQTRDITTWPFHYLDECEKSRCIYLFSLFSSRIPTTTSKLCNRISSVIKREIVLENNLELLLPRVTEVVSRRIGRDLVIMGFYSSMFHRSKVVWSVSVKALATHDWVQLRARLAGGLPSEVVIMFVTVSEAQGANTEMTFQWQWIERYVSLSSIELPSELFLNRI